MLCVFPDRFVYLLYTYIYMYIHIIQSLIYSFCFISCTSHALNYVIRYLLRSLIFFYFHFFKIFIFINPLFLMTEKKVRQLIQMMSVTKFLPSRCFDDSSETGVLNAGKLKKSLAFTLPHTSSLFLRDPSLHHGRCRDLKRRCKIYCECCCHCVPCK